MKELENIEKKVSGAADYVVGQADKVVDTMGDLLSGDSGRKVAGGAAIGALAAVVLPVSLVSGAVVGAGYVAFRQLSRKSAAADTSKDVAPKN